MPSGFFITKKFLKKLKTFSISLRIFNCEINKINYRFNIFKHFSHSSLTSIFYNNSIYYRIINIFNVYIKNIN